MSVKPNYQHIRNACTFFGSNTDEDIDKVIAEFRVRKIYSDKILDNFVQGKFDVGIRKRYYHYCYCENYTSYGSTLKPGVAYAMLASPLSCANCEQVHTVFNNALCGLWPASRSFEENELTKFINRMYRRADNA